MSEQNKILQIDVTIETSEMFRINLDLNKQQLTISAIISLAFIAGLVAFFLYVGEHEILFKLSPLFIGIPLIAVVGQILRLHATCRKYVSGLSESQRNLHFIFQDNSDGYDIISGNNFQHISWDSVAKVIERPSYFHFIFNKYESRYIPKKSFKQETDIKLLKEILTENLGIKSKLLTNSYS